MSAAKPICLALQGGGAHGAFEWGVMDALLEDGSVEIKAVTAASAGAMNAAALAAGLAENGVEGARAKLEAFWREINRSGGLNPFGSSSVWAQAISPPAWLQSSPLFSAAESMATAFSPYQFNPLNLNPLRDALSRTIDFDLIRARSPIQLFISATQVRTSKAVVFNAAELDLERVLASACLPYLFQAVTIDGEDYWDGGYLANPPLWPLFYQDTPDDVLIVNLNPFRRPETPRAAGDIMDRLNEITFNASLVAELRAVAFVQKLIDEALLTPAGRARYRRVRLHALKADALLSDLSFASKFNTEWSFLIELKDRGRRAAHAWLKACYDKVGVDSSIDVRAEFL